jgi:hypothetical protein
MHVVKPPDSADLNQVARIQYTPVSISGQVLNRGGLDHPGIQRLAGTCQLEYNRDAFADRRSQACRDGRKCHEKEV